ncbi:hypothetical protein Nm8I071_58480 [Nonomuraea sp. TT08I-71]|nr:hypothetical protein Nm8I071_58480 [Nonomuraea sp. TT08I-71]
MDTVGGPRWRLPAGRTRAVVVTPSKISIGGAQVNPAAAVPPLEAADADRAPPTMWTRRDSAAT